MLRELPRAGVRLTGGDFALALGSLWRGRDGLAEAFAQWLPAQKVISVSSGRAALLLILRSLAEHSGRREVILPAYTCPTVALSVARAGLVVQLCDVDPSSGNMDPAGLEAVLSSNTLAIVPVHMHGIPCAMPAILDAARKYGAYVIEDCAQAAGAMYCGRRVGTFGDAAFFSLGRGKGFTAYEGGIAVIGDSLAVPARSTAPMPRNRQWKTEGVVIIKLLAMAAFFHPRLYWMVRGLPLGWDNEVYAEDFEIGGIGDLRQGVALAVLLRLERLIAQRASKADYLRDRLQGVAGVQLLEGPEQGVPSYPWLPLLVDRRDELVSRLRSKGLGAASLFTHSLNRYDYLQEIVPHRAYPVAEYVAAHLLTLPTHEYVTYQDMDKMVQVLDRIS